MLAMRTARRLALSYFVSIFFLSPLPQNLILTAAEWKPRPRIRCVRFAACDRENKCSIDPVTLTECVCPGRRHLRKTKSFPQTLIEKSLFLCTARGGDVDKKAKSGWWPPWPFNLLQQSSKAGVGGDLEETKSTGGYASGAELFLRYSTEKLKAGFRQVSAVGSDASLHLPPSAPPLILLALLPVNKSALSPQAGYVYMFARRMALSSLGISAVSWAHYELRKTKRLAPLPMKISSDVKHAVLPPFLPERLIPIDPSETDSHLTDCEPEVIDSPVTENIGELDEDLSLPRWQRQVRGWYQSAPKPTLSHRTFAATYRQWKRMRYTRRRKMEDAKRVVIMEELIAYQQMKAKVESETLSQQRRNRGSKSVTDEPGIEEIPRELQGQTQSPLGWALVTGASRGIGRAFAVQLARWEIPLILVARDLVKLNALASDIETCYGVRCIVVEADLSLPGTATKLFNATRRAGLQVDIVVNNAGLSASTDFVETEVETIDHILQVNARSVAELSRLYGKEMKHRKRGRILIVSSITGALPGVPGSAVYAASKAFQKSLALSIGKELEPHGVGVTCLMPGAVRGTAFAERSKMEEALCWKYPFYPKSAPDVAKVGVRALLSGDSEAIPGWQNRALLRFFQPLLPQRLTILIAETSWKPFRFHLPKLRFPDAGTAHKGGGDADGQDKGATERLSREYSRPTLTLDSYSPAVKDDIIDMNQNEACLDSKQDIPPDFLFPAISGNASSHNLPSPYNSTFSDTMSPSNSTLNAVVPKVE